MFKNIIKQWQRKRLLNKKFDFLFDESPEGEYISLDCETTGLIYKNSSSKRDRFTKCY